MKTIIERKMCILALTTTFIWNVSYSKKNSARYHECRYVFM